MDSLLKEISVLWSEDDREEVKEVASVLTRSTSEMKIRKNFIANARFVRYFSYIINVI